MKKFILLIFLALLRQVVFAQCPTPTVTASGPTTICSGDSVILSAPAANAWTQKADFGGAARNLATGFSIGSKGYIGTGSTGSSSYLKDFWEYDPVTNAWTQKADFGGEGRYGATGFSIGSKGYIGTGSSSVRNYFKDFWEYDPAANAWAQKADFGGVERFRATGFSIGNKGYIGTGASRSNDFKDFWEYDPAANAWAQKADFGGAARNGATGFSIGSKGYIGTGLARGYSTRDFWEYDPATNAWAQKAAFGGVERYVATGFSIGNKGYIGTGFNFYGYIVKDFWEYDPAANTWASKADFGGAARFGAIGFSIGSKGYIGTGFGAGVGYSKDFWEYDPGYSYSWLPGGQTTSSIPVTEAGNYTVTTTNALGCSATSAAITVTVNPLPQVTLSSSDVDNKIYTGEAVTFTATSATATNYQFFVGEIAVQSSASNTYITNKLTNGQVVIVKVTTANGCAANSTGISTAVNAIPVAKDDAYEVNEDEVLTIAADLGVLHNDTDADKNTLKVAVVSGSNVTHGSLMLNSNGSFTYTPTANYHGPDAFTYQVSDGEGGTATATVTLTVNAVNDAPVVMNKIASQTVQYSDPITAVIITATDADQNLLTVTTGWQKTGDASFTPGLPAGLSLTAGNPYSWTLAGKIGLAPGTYTIRVTVGDGTGDAANNSGYTEVEILVAPENAVADYTGAQAIATSSATSGTALLTLSATLRDITAVTTNPLTDAFAGDIRKAKVRFLLDGTAVVNTNATNGAITDAQGWTSVVLVNATDIKTGTVLVKVPVTIGSADAQQFTLRVEVAGYYTAEEETAVINVYNPLNDFVTGGGYIIPTKSSGTYASDAGRKTNFGFNVKYNKSGKSLQGNINAIFRRKESDGLVHVYQIKGNSMTSLSVNAKVATAKTAIFNGKATLQDITNPTAPISLGGNLTLQVSMTDKGEPGKSDLLGITVFSSTGGILYASNWDGVKTAEMLLSGGNIIINSGSVTTTTSTTTAIKTAVNPGATEVFTPTQPTLTAYPNPVTDRATIEFSFIQNEEYTLAIYDLKGTLVTQLPGGKVKAGKLKQIAWQRSNAAAGLYIVKLTTATSVQQLKLMVE